MANETEPNALVTLPMRVDPSFPARLDKIAEAMPSQAGYRKPNRALASRVAIERGIVALELELGLAKPEHKVRTKKVKP